MGNAFISFFTTFNGLTGDYIADTILFSLLTLVSATITFYCVGTIFDTIGYYNSTIMKIVYAILLVVIFLVLFFLFKISLIVIIWLFSSIKAILSFLSHIHIGIYILLLIFIVLAAVSYKKLSSKV